VTGSGHERAANAQNKVIPIAEIGTRPERTSIRAKAAAEEANPRASKKWESIEPTLTELDPYGYLSPPLGRLGCAHLLAPTGAVPPLRGC